MTKKSSRWLKRLFRLVLALVVFGVVGGVFLAAAANRSMGQSAAGPRLEKMERSTMWDSESAAFRNKREQVNNGFSYDTMREFFVGGSEHREPKTEIKRQPKKRADFDTPPASGLRVTWLGHSTFIVELGKHRVLVDPVWGPRASPWSFIGPQRWYPSPLPIEELPEITAVVISHDHYDHLDMPTVDMLKDKGIDWVVPLGVGAHLEYWGVPPEHVFDLDWWEEKKFGDLTLTSTPARHFSGRAMPGDNGGPTLWSGWAMTTPEHRVYYSGDTAMFDELLEIGKRLGPFDITMIETGAYNKNWADVHMGPEQAVRAHRLVRGKVFLPVHWGLFDLALHGWTEPIERVLVAADKEGVTAVSPPPGGWVEPAAPARIERWWPDLPWDTVDKHPTFSSGTTYLMKADALPPPAPALDPVPSEPSPPTDEGGADRAATNDAPASASP